MTVATAADAIAAGTQLESVPCAVCGATPSTWSCRRGAIPRGPSTSRPSSAPRVTSPCRTRWCAARRAISTTCARACAGSSSSRGTRAARTRTSSPRSPSASGRSAVPGQDRGLARAGGEARARRGGGRRVVPGRGPRARLRALGLRAEHVDVQASRRSTTASTCIPGTIFDMPVEPGTVDLLTLFDVIEHTPDPQAVLRRAHELLTPDGVLAMSYPDYGSLAARLPRLALAVPAHRAPLLLHAADHDRAPAPDGLRARGLQACTCRPSSSATCPARLAVPGPPGRRSSRAAPRPRPRPPAALILGRADDGRRAQEVPTWRAETNSRTRGTVVVLGGGVAGLAAAYYLARAASRSRSSSARRCWAGCAAASRATASPSTTARTSSTRWCRGSSTRSAGCSATGSSSTRRRTASACSAATSTIR